MTSPHMEELFSSAYDGQLSPEQRQKFDDHLVACGQCATQFAIFTSAVDAVRELPAAHMPVGVKLPAGAPGQGGWWHGVTILAALQRMARSPAWVAAPLAVGVAAVIVVSVAISPGKQLHNTFANVSNGLSGGSGPEVAAVPPKLDQVQGASPTNCESTTLSPTVTTTAPPSFDNRVVKTDPGRPHQELVLATSSKSYAPGATVLVYARLIMTSENSAASNMTTAIPCVQLQSLPTGTSDTSHTEPFAITAAPTPSIAVVDGPLQGVTVPVGVPHGATVVLVAQVSAGTPADSTSPITVSLPITVA